MAALETRAAIDARGDFYLTRLPLTGEAPGQFAAWVEAAVTGPRQQDLVAIGVDSGRVGMGYEFSRDQRAVLAGTEHTWSERVEVIRSEALADTQARALERRLEGDWRQLDFPSVLPHHRMLPRIAPLGATKCPAFWPFGSTRPSLSNYPKTPVVLM
jgi:hypothetical protein